MATSRTTPSTNIQQTKRRRVPGTVTINACNECRRKRAKCDGNQPCGGCKARSNQNCVYETPTRISKPQLRKELDALREQQDKTNLVLAGLGQPIVQSEILARLQARQSIDSIASWLASTEQRPKAIAAPAADSGSASARRILPPSSNDALFDPGGMEETPPLTVEPSIRQKSPNWSQARRETILSERATLQDLSDLPEPARSRLAAWAESRHATHVVDGTDEPRALGDAVASLQDSVMRQGRETWTTVTSSMELVAHLLGLYFCWEHPTFASLSKEQFLRDFCQGRPRYCSPLLVNALLSLGCRFSRFPGSEAARPDEPCCPPGQHFFNEALRLLHREPDHHSLLVIQALGVLSIREASCGHSSESMAYAGQSMRLAVEMGLHRMVERSSEGRETDEFAVLSATYWGAFSLDQAWSLTTYSLPCFSKQVIGPPKPPILQAIENSPWLPYTDAGTPPNGFHGQLSHVRSVFRSYVELSELTHQIVYLFHSPGEQVTAKRLLAIYASCVTWFDNVPTVLKLGHNFTPAVLFSHMQYHFSILLLFRPFLRLDIIGSAVVPKKVCLQSANSMSALLRWYAQLYTLKRTPTFLPYFILTSSVTLLSIGILTARPNADGRGTTVDPNIIDNVQQGMDGLAEIAPCHQFAEQAVSILSLLAQNWNIDLQIGAGATMDPDSQNTSVEPYFSRPNLFTDDRLARSLIVGDQTRCILEEESKRIKEAMSMMEKLVLQPIPLKEPLAFLQGPKLAEHGFANA
ncbi:pathway-specific nitrogen regulator [Cordyceps militaris]|uniref:Pathway-specific nitrogen regulator n=1 Tax=Cordyceps militaris TaxID=73501 RepID=A0A2H4S701_CORMI|nr:pathway-specific nitrogen regulator [Cordyceps militaris]